MDYTKRLGNAAVVPVVVIENIKDAVPTAKALLAGGIDIMEITLRTSAGLASIEAVAKEVPEMLVGAGTVLDIEQGKAVIEAGAKFIVSPGYDEELVSWCCQNDITVTPGCVTPSEIMAAMKHGLKVLKFFPANVYGGLTAMKGLSAPFGGIKFIPTGGVNGQNIGEYSAAPFVHTVGGSWVCTKKDIAEGNFEKITKLCREAVVESLGFAVKHIGINCENEEHAIDVTDMFNNYFSLGKDNHSKSLFSSSSIEIMKTQYKGENGHIAISTNNGDRAFEYLVAKGLTPDMETAGYKNGRLNVVYFKESFGGFAIHLLQK